MKALILTALLFCAGAPISDIDQEYLRNLCFYEVRGMGEDRHDACLDVVDTLMYRKENGILTDGTVWGTLMWGTQPENIDSPVQFVPAAGYLYHPPFVKRSPYNLLDPENDLYWADDAINDYVSGERGKCAGYPFYDSLERGNEKCTYINENNGQRIDFYDG